MHNGVANRRDVSQALILCYLEYNNKKYFPGHNSSRSAARVVFYLGVRNNINNPDPTSARGSPHRLSALERSRRGAPDFSPQVPTPYQKPATRLL